MQGPKSAAELNSMAMNMGPPAYLQNPGQPMGQMMPGMPAYLQTQPQVQQNMMSHNQSKPQTSMLKSE
jgi:hypothetical protein